MDHREIRALRGSLSRAAFARQLGVSALTVLRWELPEDSKEARRPRPRMVEALRRFAQGTLEAPAAPAPGAALVDDDDGDEHPPPAAPAAAAGAASPLPAAAQPAPAAPSAAAGG